MKTSILLLVLTSFIAIFFYSVSTQKQTTNKIEIPTIIPTDFPTPAINGIDIMKLVNEYRLETNRPKLIYSDFLCSIANKRLTEIRTDWSHNGFLKSKYCDNCTLGENLSKNFLFSDQVMDGWLNSQPHKRILDMNYTHSCIATDGDYIVQIFG